MKKIGLDLDEIADSQLWLKNNSETLIDITATDEEKTKENYPELKGFRNQAILKFHDINEEDIKLLRDFHAKEKLRGFILMLALFSGQIQGALESKEEEAIAQDGNRQ